MYKRSKEGEQRRLIALRSESSREKISSTAKVKGFGKWMKGKKLSEETKSKMSLAKIGKKIPYKKRSPQTIETRIKLSNAHKGEKNWNWKGGISKERARIYNSLEYRLWRESVFKRDDWTCVFCDTRSGCGKRNNLNADHIKPFALYPELRFAIDNGRTLCVPCHRKTDTYGGRKIYKSKLTMES